MFQKLTIHRITAGLPGAAESLSHYLEHSEFFPTSPSQQKAIGFAPPRAEHGAFVEAIGGHWIARLVIETRKVPGDALQRRIDEVVATIEQNEGRKPGRKERAEIKEAVVDELLPKAFPKRAVVPLWIDPRAGLLLIGSTSAGQVDDAITALVRAVPDLQVTALVTQTSPAALMRSWLLDGVELSDDDRYGFSNGRECELRANDESKAVVRYKNQDLNRDDVREHIKQEKSPVRLALDYKGRVSFTLTDGLQLKGIEFIDVAVEGADEQDEFDADVAIATGELSRLIADLIYALGGAIEAKPEEPKDVERQPIADDQAARMAATAYNPDGEGIDPLIDRARGLVVAHQRGGISLIQRHLQIGYNRAARLLEALEVEGTVSAMRNDGRREVLVKGGAA